MLAYTPLSVLSVEGMDDEQVWGQMELRAEGFGKVLKEVGAVQGEEIGVDHDEDGADVSEGEEEESDEEMSVEEFRRMMLAGEGDEDSGSESESEESDGIGEEGGIRFRDEVEGFKMAAGESSDADEEDDVDDDANVEGVDEDEDDDDEENSGLEDEEGSGSEDGGFDDERDEDVNLIGHLPNGINEDDEDDQRLRFGTGPSRPSRRKRHPILDDKFFSIDEFNRLTEEAEAGRLSRGRLGGDEEDEEELGDVGTMMLQGGEEEDRKQSSSKMGLS